MADTTKTALSGKRVVITRPIELSPPIAEALRSHGAEPILLPVVRIQSPQDFSQLDDALHDLAKGKFDWVIFGSQNAVHAVTARASMLGIDLRGAAKSLQTAAVGRVTAGIAEQSGFKVTRTGKGTGADLIADLAKEIHAKHVFLPRSDRAGAAHFAQLHQAGAHVREVIAYRTVPSDTLDQAAVAAASNADAILFFSPSAVHAFAALIKSGVLHPVGEVVGVGAVGPVTRENLLKEAGMRCDFQAHEPVIEQVIAALAEYFESKQASSVGGRT